MPRTLKDSLLCLLLAALAAFAIAGALWLRTLDRVTAQLPATLDAAIAREGAATRKVFAEQVQALASRTDWRMTAIQHDLFARVDAGLGVVQTSANRGLDLVDARSGDALDQVAGLRCDLKPALAHLTEASAQLETASRELPGALRDGRFLLARAARATGHVEQMSDKIEAAVPRTLAGWDRIVTNSDATTAETTRLMSHLADATKPLPTWARIGLAVAPPLVQTGFTIGSWMALKGKTK